MTVTVQTDSRGDVTITNNSLTYHYKGTLDCLATCPGPDPNGCSASSTFVNEKTLAPGGTANCIIFQMTDPCCQDDGNFVVGAVFEAQEYRTSATAPWTSLAPHYQYAVNLDSNEDAGPGHPDPHPNKPPKSGDISLAVSCNNPPRNTTKITVINSNEHHYFKVMARFAITCPTDGNQIPNCYCPVGFCKSYTTSSCTLTCQPPGCDSPKTCTSCGASCDDSGGCVCDVPGDSHTVCAAADPNHGLTEPPCGASPGFDVSLVCTPYPKGIDESTNQIVWAERIVKKQVDIPTETLSECCDYINSLNRRSCVEIDTIQKMAASSGNSAWANATQPWLDVSDECSVGDDLDPNKIIGCFEGFLADPSDPNDTDPTVLCENPI